MPGEDVMVPPWMRQCQQENEGLGIGEAFGGAGLNAKYQEEPEIFKPGSTAGKPYTDAEINQLRWGAGPGYLPSISRLKATIDGVKASRQNVIDCVRNGFLLYNPEPGTAWSPETINALEYVRDNILKAILDRSI